jgi:hypothetical protein
VLRAATAPNSPAIFFSMMSLQMPSAHPRVGRKREKAAICSIMGGTLPACCLARLRQIDLAAAFGRLLFRRGCATTPAAYLSTLVPYREGPKIRQAERMVSQYGRPPLNRGGGCSARSQTLHQCQCPAPFLGDAPPAFDPDHHSLREDTNIRKARARRLVSSLHSRPLVASIAMSRFKSAIEAHPSGWLAKIFSTVT